MRRMFVTLCVLVSCGTVQEANDGIERWRCLGLEDYKEWTARVSVADIYGDIFMPSFPDHQVAVRLSRPADASDGIGEVQVAGIAYTAIFVVRGADRKWYFGERSEYSFVITPDRYGAYFDFSNAEEGEEIPATRTYRCVSP